MGAPVCLIDPRFKDPWAPTILSPSIPIANDGNLVDTVNALRSTVLALTNQNTGGNNGGFQPSDNASNPNNPNNNNNNNNNGGNYGNDGNGGNGGNGGGGSFTVVNQVVQQVKIYDPNDASRNTFVTINQVIKLVLQQKTTGAIWIWNAPAIVPNPSGG
jgi:hypothetical protein